MSSLLAPLLSSLVTQLHAASALGLLITPEGIFNYFGPFATIALIAIIFAETGIALGFFLPGDSLLFTAGLFAAQGELNLAVILVGCFIAAVVGDQVGYLFGKRVGPALFGRPDSRIFKQKYVTQADRFFQRHGPKTIVLARFVPIVRTFAPIVAGVGKMKYRQFVTYNIGGGFAWTFGFILLGYSLGNVDWVKNNLEPVVLVIVLISVIPAVIEVLRHRSGDKTADHASIE